MNAFPSIFDVMCALKARRTVFHSEADFQQALAWEVQALCPEASIYLERPFRTKAGNIFVDILARTANATLAIELKYKTRKLQANSEHEDFDLADHSASDFGRYDFIKDIARIENVSKSFSNFTGWAIMVTNDPSYWGEQRKMDVADRAFKIAEGRILEGNLTWPESYSLDARPKREAPLILENSYKLSWVDYSDDPKTKNGRFRYLPVIVSSNSAANPTIPASNERIKARVRPVVRSKNNSAAPPSLSLKARLLHLMQDHQPRSASEWAVLLRHGATQTQQLLRDLRIDGNKITRIKRDRFVFYSLEADAGKESPKV